MGDQPQNLPPYTYAPLQQPEPAEPCPICEMPIGNKSKWLYGQPVCKRCSTAFANSRQFAYLLDFGLFYASATILLTIIAAFIAAVVGPGEEARLIYNLIRLGLVVIFLMKDGMGGYSPGKLFMGLQVIDIRTGKPAGVGASLKRNLPLLIPFMVFFVAFDLIKGQRCGDGWAKTRVIWKKYAGRMPFASLFPPPPVI